MAYIDADTNGTEESSKFRHNYSLLNICINILT